MLGAQAPPAVAVDLRSALNDATPLLHRVSPVSQLLRVAPPLCLASVLSSSRGLHLDFSLCIEATGSHVPHKSLDHAHATFMPDAAQPVSRHLLDLIPRPLASSVLTSFLRFRHVISGSLAFVFAILT